MKNNHGWRTCCAFLLCMGFFCSTASARQAEKTLINVGYSGMGTEVDERDACAALKVWAREIGEPLGFQVKTTLYESKDDLVRDFVAQKVDFATMVTSDYLRFAPVLKAKAEVARFRNKKISVQYLLLVNAENNIKELVDLKGKRLVYKKDNSLGMLFMDVLLMKAGLPAADRFFTAVQEKTKENQLALAVFFNQADACLVSESGFATMVELNPQMGKKLKVLATSPELVEVVGFFRKDYPPSDKQKAIEGIVKGAKASKRAKQIMLLFNTESMELIEDHQLDSVRGLVAEYNRLSGKK
ncbi:MAG: PhnD/SsuA/transferrin family substrate-binding protein [Deltaproteobacteria bacterium]|nr:PhnD/SsuA/transferrin family substrate-binding protein [Deltaproteobacteria bacterium]